MSKHPSNGSGPGAFVEFARFYRPLGFFARFADYDEGAFAALIHGWFRDNSPRDPPTHLTTTDEVFLLSLDSERLWVQDSEADWGIGGPVYARVLLALAGISRGTFNPIIGGESWDESGKVVDITFRVDLTKYKIRAHYSGGYLQLTEFLEKLNPIVAAKGMHFAIINGDRDHPTAYDQCYYIVGLTVAEREILEREKGWRLGPTYIFGGPDPLAANEVRSG